jgi:ribose transport system ATP-binding protein
LFFDAFSRQGGLKTISLTHFNQKTKVLFEEFGIQLEPARLVKKCSFSQKYIIQILKAYLQPAKVIIFDESCAVFTDFETHIFYEIVERLKQKGKGVFVISHRLKDIYQLADRISIIENGKVIETIDRKQVPKNELIRLLVGMRFESRYPKISYKKGQVCFEVQGLVAEPVLKEISFAMREGEVLGITGLAGSGKSYLAKCLFGINQYQKGRVEVKGEKLEIQSTLAAIEKGLALIPENILLEGVLPQFSIADNVAFGALKDFVSYHMINYSFLKERAKGYMKDFGMEEIDLLETDISRYPRGVWQKILFIRWMMKETKFFILDEPTYGIDVPSKVDTYNCINHIAQKGGSVLLISSDFEELIGMCDRILILYEGRIVKELVGKQTTKEEILAYCVGGDAI